LKHGNMETYIRNMETWKHGDKETWRHGNMETRKHGDMETWRHGHGDVDMGIRKRNMETCRHRLEDTDNETWTTRHGLGDMDLETWTWRHGHGHGYGDMYMET
jgi:hypothetical protein